MNIETISQNVPYLYLLLSRQKSLKKTEKKQEKNVINPVEPALYSSLNRGVDYKESGKNIDFYV